VADRVQSSRFVQKKRAGARVILIDIMAAEAAPQQKTPREKIACRGLLDCARSVACFP
jgi:hypothetical protein